MAVNSFWSPNTGGYGSGFSSLYNTLSDKASIRNGTYKKLLKSYYGTNKTSGSSSSSSSNTSSTETSKKKNVLDTILEEKKNPKVSKDVQKSNENLKTGLSNLNESVSALQSDKIYTDTENGQSAESKVASALKYFVSDYNNTISAAKGSTLSRQTSYVANMMSTTSANADKLSEIGITVNTDGTLEFNREKMNEAGVSKVQELFSSENIMSYGSTISSRLRFAGSTSSTNSTTGSTSTDTDKTTNSAAALEEDSRELASEKLYETIKDKDGNDTNKYDVDKIYSTAKSFVNNYNRMFESNKSSSNSGVIANLEYINEKTSKNKDSLKQFGINIDDNGKLTIDEDTFKKSDMSKVHSFFKDYGSSIATNASLVDYYMTTQANASNGYKSDGGYNVQGNVRYNDYI